MERGIYDIGGKWGYVGVYIYRDKGICIHLIWGSMGIFRDGYGKCGYTWVL